MQPCLVKSEKRWTMRAARGILFCSAIFVSSGVGAQRATPSRVNVALYSRLLAMTDSRTFNRALIDSALASTWAPLRAAAALGIGQVGTAHGMEGVPRLRELLIDRDEKVASNAAYALGLLHDSASVQHLAAQLPGTPRVAREAAWALGEIGAPARTAITSALAGPVTDEARMIQLLLAAAKLRPVPVESLRRYLTMTNPPSIIWAASYAIARSRSPAGVRDLIALANQPAFIQAASEKRVSTNAPPSSALVTAEAYISPSALQRTRAEIGRALSKAAAGDSLGDRAFNVLSRLALDPHPHVRINAVRSLATYGSRGKETVVASTRDADANTRIAAAQVLGTVLDSTLVAWRPLWGADTSLMYRSSLLASAAAKGVRLPELETWQGHPDWRYRAAALNAAANAGNVRFATQVGNEMKADKDGRVRAAAYSAIAGNDTTLSPAVHDALMPGLSDPDYIVRAGVIGTLARRPNAVDTRTVVDAYERAARDSGNDARIAAISYVAAAWKRDSAVFAPQLRERIGRLHPSTDPLVRAEAAHSSVFRGWESTSGTSKPIEWYQSIVRTYVLPSLAGNRPRATIRTVRGDIVLDLYGADAPITVDNFLRLAKSGYYRGTRFHRVVPNFVIQDGDPRDDGNGGPGYAIRDEMNPRRYDRGALGMALSGPDTGGSQYFITHSPQAHLDGHYTVFGRVLRGYPALDTIVQGDPITSVIAR
ncbi:MAG TPA: peptidylprolyl isomerase [Gemmatimonadaceae bacterium]|nr:peptidylprolyl isomerase [Gemmatimonadaceae bacterium]